MNTPAIATPLLAGEFVAGADSDDYQQRMAIQWLLILFGATTIEIPLSGGSDTRRGVREHWRERC